MSRRLPPLTALRTFEAAARHRSFIRAAAELHVTPAAISHQIRQLEDWLALKLFERQGNALRLSAAGKAYLPELSRSLDLLASATERLGGPDPAGPLRLGVLPSFATKWLLPRFGQFRAAHPEIDLHVRTILAPDDFAAGACDLEIRLGSGRWPGLQSDLIAHEALSPMGSPALLARAPLRKFTDLRRHTLLHDQPRDLWARWLELVGAKGIEANVGPSFTDASHVLQAAIDGHGIALGRIFLAADDLAAKRLLKPFSADLPNDFGYWLVVPRSSTEQPRVMAFRRWILDATAEWREGGMKVELLQVTSLPAPPRV